MAPLMYPFLAICLIISVSSALTGPIIQLDERTSSAPVPPSLDPWYIAPSHFEREAPGKILRVRHAPGNLSSAIANCSAAYNILYRTTNSLYQPAWAVTTLFVPTRSTKYTARTTAKTALLSYQIPYDTVDVDFSPSYTLYDNGLPDIPTMLGKGWWVNVPDFEGPLASFGAGVMAGHATIDSIRAVLSADLGVGCDSKYAMWGYSGGSIASEFAAELQVQYAPEMSFAGMAIGGIIANTKTALDSLNRSPYAGIIPEGLLGTTTQHPEASAYLLNRLKTTGPFNRTYFLAARKMSIYQAFAAFAYQDIYGYFIGGQADIEAPVMQKALNRDGVMGYHGVPQMPIFVYKAVGDEFSKVGDTDEVVERWCGIGVNVLYERNLVGEHLSEFGNGIGRSLAFLESVFDGTYGSKYQSEGCTVKDVSVGSAIMV